MADETQTGWYIPEANYVSVHAPRISGTALIGGLHLSTGNYGTASSWRLFLSGLGIVASLAIGLVLTYVELWVLDFLTGLNLTTQLLGLAGTGEMPGDVYGLVAMQLLPMANFLVVLRLSPLSGYHAAEHKVVGAVEAYGDIQYQQVVEMPRAHPRCGTVLLFGVLPTLLVAYPLFFVNPLAAAVIAVVGWSVRYRVGYFIQQYLTTKPPTPKQLKAGIEAGRKLLRLWEADPDRPVSFARNLWTRGLPQMLAGVLIGQYLLNFIGAHLHVWLDF